MDDEQPPDSRLEQDISAWHDREVKKNTASVPDFWDDHDTSFRLAQFLASIGYVKAAPQNTKRPRIAPRPRDGG